MKHMAFKQFGVVEQLPEERGLLGKLDAEGGFGGLEGGGGMGDGADAADARGDGGDVVVIAAPEHPLEEARRLGDFPQHPVEFTVSGFQVDVAVTLDAGQLVNLDL